MHCVLRTKINLVSALLAGLVLVGCGESSSKAHTSAAHTTTTPQSLSSPSAAGVTSSAASATTSAAGAGQAPNSTIPLRSSVALTPIPARYTCDGANVSLPLNWGQVPAHTAELDLVVLRLKGAHGKLYAAWAVAGLQPSLKNLAAGQLPAGAVVGSNSIGRARYSVCPSKGSNAQYYVLLFALPHRVRVAHNFNASGLAERLLHMPVGEGTLSFTYKRR
jgi:phosphatidylethanolamine-binding protein (PEBP) family uncharacterized protein